MLKDKRHNYSRRAFFESMKREVTDTPGRFAMAACKRIFVEKSITQ